MSTLSVQGAPRGARTPQDFTPAQAGKPCGCHDSEGPERPQHGKRPIAGSFVNAHGPAVLDAGDAADAQNGKRPIVRPAANAHGPAVLADGGKPGSPHGSARKEQRIRALAGRLAVLATKLLDRLDHGASGIRPHRFAKFLLRTIRLAGRMPEGMRNAAGVSDLVATARALLPSLSRHAAMTPALGTRLRDALATMVGALKALAADGAAAADPPTSTTASAPGSDATGGSSGPSPPASSDAGSTSEPGGSESGAAPVDAQPQGDGTAPAGGSTAAASPGVVPAPALRAQIKSALDALAGTSEAAWPASGPLSRLLQGILAGLKEAGVTGVKNFDRVVDVFLPESIRFLGDMAANEKVDPSQYTGSYVRFALQQALNALDGKPVALISSELEATCDCFKDKGGKDRGEKDRAKPKAA